MDFYISNFFMDSIYFRAQITCRFTHFFQQAADIYSRQQVQTLS